MPVPVKMAAAAAVLVGSAIGQTLTATYGSTTGQTMAGFGVSQAFGRASEFQAMASGPRKQGLDYLFSTETGAGLSMIRNRIGSGGSGDSILPTSPGCPTCTPKYVWDGNDSGQVWFSQQAQTYGVSTIYADAWSAPGFMKTNGDQSNGGYLCGMTGHSCSSGDWRQAYANMLVQYVKYYAQEGVRITHLGFLNEADYSTGYSSMLASGTEAASFIPTLHSTVQSNNVNVNLTCCDYVGWDSQKTATAQLISAGVTKYLNVITSHTYSSDATSPINTGGLPTWVTEAADLTDAFCTTWYSSGGLCEGMTWANKLAQGVVSADLSAYFYWEGVEVNQPQAASYLVASDGNTVTPSGRLWAFAMWSRFVRPGAQRLTTSGALSNVLWAAFKNTDGSVVAVFTNSGGSSESASFSVSGFTPAAASAWLTDNSHSVSTYAASLSGPSVAVSVPAHAVVTVKLTRSGGSSGSGGGGGDGGGNGSGSSGGSGTCSALYGQCGGQGYSGPTCCSTGSCKYSNDWYSQCL